MKLDSIKEKMKLVLRFVLFALLLFAAPARAEIKGDIGANIKGDSVEVVTKNER